MKARQHAIGGSLSTWLLGCGLAAGLGLAADQSGAAASADPLAWPAITRECRPSAYWWWMGSAVDTTNLTRELERYRAAGMGGVHIIPIYGAKGWEERYQTYLSPEWMEMLRHTVKEAQRLDLNVDMTTGSGWCFGGPRVTDDEANASVTWRMFDVPAGGRMAEKFEAGTLQALMAFGPEGKAIDLTGKVAGTGAVDWTVEGGPWRVYAVFQRPSGQKVKRAAPGGQGHMLNLIYPQAMTNYLRWFDEAFARYNGPKPRAQYHDSYEYRSDWAPDFLAQFEKRRGYRLQDELPALFRGETSPLERSRRGQSPDASAARPAKPTAEELDRAARVRCDYRETVSDIMAEVTVPLWADWCRRNGFQTRNEAHGSPGNWLDLYATADIPETEMFYKDRNKLISKFASSAAHVAGKPLVACETGTWLNEHFTETLAEMKYLLDDLFLSGVNHIFYHGTCYSPDEAPWPGWLFYASYEMNPRNSVWRDVPVLNAYAARCQAVLQSGRPDNDILLYWPLHDFWHNPSGLTRNLTVHARDWFEDQPIGRTALALWNRGYAFDYVSDRQLATAKTMPGGIRTAGGTYRVIVIPPCERMPLPTFANLLALAEAGATVIFESALPKDVSGWADLPRRRTQFGDLLARVRPAGGANQDWREAKLGRGRVLAGNLESALALARVPREALFDREGLMCLRRAIDGVDGGHHYFLANRSEQRAVNGWIPLARAAQSVVILDPMTGRTGVGSLRQGRGGAPEVWLQLQPGESLILRTLADRVAEGPPWTWWQNAAAPVALSGSWQVKFLAGGPELPAPFAAARLASWTELGDTNAQRFAGTAVYSLRFDKPPQAATHWELALGQVCQSARVRLNGKDLGALIIPPFRVPVADLKPQDNLLEVEVTNVSANRIRDLDRRGVVWRNFHDINFVNLSYKPFDASHWPMTPSGLLGPVQLIPVAPVERPRGQP